MHQRRGSVIVTGPHFGDPPPPTTAPAVHQDLFDSIVLALLRPAWEWRYELLALAVPIGGSFYLSQHFSPLVALLAIAAMLTPLTLGRTRRCVRQFFRHASIRRCWNQAVRHARLANPNDHIPTPTKITDVPAGEVLTVRVPAGHSTTLLAESAEVIAAGMEVREVRVTRDVSNARYASVAIIRRDPLANAGALAWPNVGAKQLSVWTPVPVGLNELGEEVTVRLGEHHILIAGETGAGKSVALSQIVATCALDPKCVLTLLDGKQVELATWAACAKHVVGPSLDDAVSVLVDLQMEMDSRYAYLREQRKRKIGPNDAIPLHVVVCDELAFYMNMGERKQSQMFRLLARDLVARGRAAGIVMIAATQKPSHDVIDTSFRDLFSFRWALRCTTPQASDTVLGQGWAAAGFSAATIDSADRGVGFLLQEGGEPVRLRSYCLTDDDLENLGRRAERLRHSMQTP